MASSGSPQPWTCACGCNRSLMIYAPIPLPSLALSDVQLNTGTLETEQPSIAVKAVNSGTRSLNAANAEVFAFYLHKYVFKGFAYASDNSAQLEVRFNKPCAARRLFTCSLRCATL